MSEAVRTILVSPTEAMKILGIGRNMMYENLLKRNDFPVFQIGTKYFINRELLQEWANKQCKNTVSR
jgi:predicted DNA-binding transcriptional regulator AlpA